MEQRTLRLGDIVDDYCPRERRITNHAIVALVDEVIRQTRCTTCDTEHPYKGARTPRRRKKDDSLYEQVLAEIAPGARAAPAPEAAGDGADDAGPPAAAADDREDAAPDTAGGDGDSDPDAGDPGDGDDSAEPRTDDLWSGHRRLIRATLPRSENDEPTPRPIPEFTMHQRSQRGGQPFRHGFGQGQGNSNARNGFRPGRPGPGQGHGNGPGQGQGGRPHRGGRGRRGQNKRSR
jgi:hypothetical protein